jgi:ComF family protein
MRIVHALKYAGWTAAGDGMAHRMVRLAWPRDVERERAAVIPVPLAATRERERGFNQSAVIGRPLAAHWNIPLRQDCLERSRSTRTQTRLTPEERRGNVFRAFRATPACRALRGAHVVLVDDVVTTAATLIECAGTLFRAGVRVVSIVTFARAPASGDRIIQRSESRKWPFGWGSTALDALVARWFARRKSSALPTSSW